MRLNGRAICKRHACGTSLRSSSRLHGEECVLQAPESSPIRHQESCAWSCGALSWLFRGAEENPYHCRHHLEKPNWDLRNLTLSGSLRWAAVPVNCLLPRFVCRLGRFLNIQLGRGSVFVIKGFEVGARRVSNGFDRKPAVTASCIIASMRGLAASAPCAEAATSSALL